MSTNNISELYNEIYEDNDLAKKLKVKKAALANIEKQIQDLTAKKKKYQNEIVELKKSNQIREHNNLQAFFKENGIDMSKKETFQAAMNLLVNQFGSPQQEDDEQIPVVNQGGFDR